MERLPFGTARDGCAVDEVILDNGPLGPVEGRVQISASLPFQAARAVTAGRKRAARAQSRLARR